MARQNIELGTAPTGVGGDTPRSANVKINAMMTELYPLVGYGGVVDFGFAASGNYVRFSCGLQICWGYDAPYTAAVTNQDSSGGVTSVFFAVKLAAFPAAFVGYPDADAHFAATGHLVWTAQAGDSGQASANFYIMSNGPFTAAGTFYWKAIGRWK
jgi:hypothetical protein